MQSVANDRTHAQAHRPVPDQSTPLGAKGSLGRQETDSGTLAAGPSRVGARRPSFLALEPDLGPKSGERRVARFYLEAIASLQRERFTAGKLDKTRAKQLKRERDARIAEAESVFGVFAPDLSGMDKIETWEMHGENMLGLGAGAAHFVDSCFTKGVGLYDFLSDFSHPSLTAILRQTPKVETDGVARRPWMTALDIVEAQARIGCLIFYKACYLLAGYYALDESPLERWADTVPAAWFTDGLVDTAGS